MFITLDVRTQLKVLAHSFSFSFQPQLPKAILLVFCAGFVYVLLKNAFVDGVDKAIGHVEFVNTLDHHAGDFLLVSLRFIGPAITVSRRRLRAHCLCSVS